MKKIKSIWMILAISLSFNIFFLVSNLFEKNKSEDSEHNENISFLLSEDNILKKYFSLSYKELTSLLCLELNIQEKQIVLGCLTTFHYLDVDRALKNDIFQKEIKSFEIDNKIYEIEIISSLSLKEVDKILTFINKNRWPITTKGKFLLLKNYPKLSDLSLENTFFSTYEFSSIRSLFNDSVCYLSDIEILGVLIDGSWDRLVSYVDKNYLFESLSEEMKVQFLLDYIEINSKKAATALLKMDVSKILKTLEESQVLNILDLLDTYSIEAENFCLELLKKAKYDRVFEKAVEKLYYFANEKKPEIIDYEQIIDRFLTASNKEEDLSNVYEGNVHIVKDGESLWQISQIYGLEIEEIKDVNGLENDDIFPGKTLLLPEID